MRLKNLLFFAVVCVACSLQAAQAAGKKSDEWDLSHGHPQVPTQHLPSLKQIPIRAGIVVGYRKIDNAHPPVPVIFDLSNGQQSVWELPPELFNPTHQCIHDTLAMQWAPGAKQFLLTHGGALDLVHSDGTYSIVALKQPLTTEANGCMYDYALSPDGTLIAYTLNDGHSTGLYYQQLHGSDQVKLVDGGYTFHPAWSPDGKKIAFTTKSDGLGIVSITGQQLADIQPPFKREYPRALVDHIKWSPDGSRIAFLFDRKLYVINADGTGMKPIVFKPTDAEVENYSWSPDGNQFVIASNVEDGKRCSMNLGYYLEVGGFPCIQGYDLYTSNSDGSNLERITKEPFYFSYDLSWLL